jgi:hypothetical protein
MEKEDRGGEARREASKQRTGEMRKWKRLEKSFMTVIL